MNINFKFYPPAKTFIIAFVYNTTYCWNFFQKFN